MFKKVYTEQYPFDFYADRAALPRPARAQPAPRRPGEVRRLRAVRLGLPGRRDLRRGRRQHRGRSATRPVSATARLPDQLPALHLLRAVHRGLPDPVADDEQRVRAGPRQPPGADLHQGAADGAAAAGHGAAAAPDAPRRRREGLLHVESQAPLQQGAAAEHGERSRQADHRHAIEVGRQPTDERAFSRQAQLTTAGDLDRARRSRSGSSARSPSLGGARHGVRAQRRALGAVAGRDDDVARRVLHDRAGAVPRLRADHRLHRRDHDPVPVRADARRP